MLLAQPVGTCEAYRLCPGRTLLGDHKGASSATGLINGWGSISAIFGGVGVGYIAQMYSWSALLTGFGVMALLAAPLLLPKWHTVQSADTA